MNNVGPEPQRETLFGHPVGLFTLFFAEMWERFSYYGMRALLVFYMTKGFLGYGDSDAYAVYGAYTALVYMTPFFGGMLADRLLGARRAVVLGGLLMAAGHLMMTVENNFGIFAALALLIAGNGFFKPNISVIVGTLYAEGSPKRDGGFTIFYMGINLGAAMSPLLCGFIGETYGWHLGFGLATIGMMTGVAVFVAPIIVTQILIALGVIAATAGLLIFHPDNLLSTVINVFVATSLVAAGIVALVALGRGGLPKEAGAPPDCQLLRRSVGNFISLEWVVYLGTFIAIPVFALLVSGFAPFTENQRGVTLIPEAIVKRLASTSVLHGELKALEDAVRSQHQATIGQLGERLENAHNEQRLDDTQYGGLKEVVDLAVGNQWQEAAARIAEVRGRFPPRPIQGILAVVLHEASRPAGLVLMLSGVLALAYLLFETFRLDTIPRQRMYVVLILTFFSMLFWAFFEQAGISLNLFADRNVDRVFEDRRITESEIGTTIRIQPTQEQLGYRNRDDSFALSALNELRQKNEQNPNFAIDWTVAPDNVTMGGMGIADRIDEIPASTFQAVNPIYILVFGLFFTALWGFLGSRGMEPSTPVKFSLGLLQLGLGFGAFWYGAQTATERGMVHLGWLILGYMLHTTGELCLSPVGLSMVTKLAPARLVSTMMGTWFLATAFSQFLAAIISQFTGVSEASDEGAIIIPIPQETVHVYGGVFGKIAIAAIASALVCFLLSPVLSRWMHQEALHDDPE